MAKTTMHPITVSGRSLVSNWWGRAWIENLERYADLNNRISRGRAYLREGNVLDLKIDCGEVKGVVAGSRSTPYKVNVRIEPISENVARDVQSRCSEKLSDAEQLMEGRMPLSMECVVKSPNGLFPTRSDISFTCTCPDTAHMCKHVAAALLGVGVRFDSDPSLFFKLRGLSVDLFTEKTMKGRLDLMLENAENHTDRILDDSMIGTLFGVVEHMEHKRKPIEMEMLVKMLGRPLYEEGLALTDSVSEPTDIGDKMMKITVSEPKMAKQHVVIWRDRDGNPKKYGCGCDSEGICRHISASLVKIFGQEANEYEIRKERESDRIVARIDELNTCENEDVVIDEAMDICDDITETLGFDDLRTVHLIDRLLNVVHEDDAQALYPKISILSDLICSMSPEEMAKLLENDWKSWIFFFSSEIPKKTIESIYSRGQGSIGKENWAEILFLVGRYDEYVDDDKRNCDRILRCIYSASNSGREEDALKLAGALASSDVPFKKRKEVESILKKYGLNGMAPVVAKQDFIKNPSARTLKNLESSCRIPRDALIRDCWNEILSQRVPTAYELRFFAENCGLELVGEYLTSDKIEVLFRTGCDYEELGWLFNILLDGSDYLHAAILGRHMTEQLMSDYRMYPMAIQLLKVMNNNEEFENLPGPQSEYMIHFREKYGSRRKFWKDYNL